MKLSQQQWRKRVDLSALITVDNNPITRYNYYLPLLFRIIKHQLKKRRRPYGKAFNQLQ